MNFVFNKTTVWASCVIAVSVLCFGVVANPVGAQGADAGQTDTAPAALEHTGVLAETDDFTESNESTETGTLTTTVDSVDSGFSRNEALIASLTIFSLAVFVGFEIITKVPPTLHTPLMSGSNAISGITLVGAALVAGGSSKGFAGFLGMLAVALAAINVVGGFLVTDRMLSMFQKKK